MKKREEDGIFPSKVGVECNTSIEILEALPVHTWSQHVAKLSL